MENQYVYIARLVNHKNQFLEGYYKLGKTKQYKIRETQLNSTHLPIDVQLVRVFKTSDMVRTETIFQTCFEDYQVIKVYDFRKSITTEWFDVDDEEKLFNRIDKICRVLNDIVEVDLIKDIKRDVETTKVEKAELIENLRKTKSRLKLVFHGEDISMDTSTDTFMLALKKISDIVGWDKIMKEEIRVTKTREELYNRNPSSSSSQLKNYDDHYIFTGNNNEVKKERILSLIEKFSLNDIEISTVYSE